MNDFYSLLKLRQKMGFSDFIGMYFQAEWI